MLLRAVKVMADGLPGGTSFMEDYTYDLTAGAERVLSAHMLEVCPSIADGIPAAEVHPLSIGGRSDPVRLRFAAAAGEAVIVDISDIGDRFRWSPTRYEWLSQLHNCRICLWCARFGN